VGGRKTIPVDVRIVAATNKDLEAEIKKGQFRPDLYYRLNVIHIRMPTLREIREDIPLFANYFLDKYCQEMKKGAMNLTPRALSCLLNHFWPGNVRELENEIKRLVVSVRRKAIAEEDLSEAIRRAGGVSPPSQPMSEESLKETVAELEKRMILDALRRCEQNQQHAAAALGLSRQGLINKMKRYGIKSSA